MSTSSGAPWLLLIHQIPPKPNYLRVKVWRRLQRLGAVAIKNSVYILPKSESAYEDFEWVRREIVACGGEASICEAHFVEGLEDAGELIPHARKHLARATGPKGQHSVKLADLFPEPDWHRVSLIRGAECAAHLFMLYDSLATSPRAGHSFGVSPSEWRRGYEEGIALVREFFVQATNVLNHANLIGFTGVQTSPFFGLPIAALPGRRIETGMRFSF